MTDHPKQTWSGASGTKYTYYVYERQPDVTPDQIGNYIYCKKNEKGNWVPIYIGEGDLSVRCTKSHHQIQCINSKGATHVHMHLNKTDADRFAEESDLLARFTNAYVPTGCNVKRGG